jgi:hypothetical protein
VAVGVVDGGTHARLTPTGSSTICLVSAFLPSKLALLISCKADLRELDPEKFCQQQRGSNKTEKIWIGRELQRTFS